MNRHHIGSTLVIAFGILPMIVGLTKNPSLLKPAVIIMLGALAYRSAKRRYLKEREGTVMRRILEIAAIIIIICIVVFQNNLLHLIETEPVPTLVIPLLAVIAYSIFGFRKPKAT